MYWTQTLIPTMKETPEGAEIPSHVLMLRAGLVSQVMAGAYAYLPLGLKSLKKAERIVREEMDAAGAVELALPAMSPLGLWEQTGRVAAFGNVLVQTTLQRKDRKVPIVFGPTHEEIITDFVAHHISSYRQMPITLYQITSKFRNEERPRFGVLRTSEFLMKDAYSFNASVESLNQSYDKMYAAYCKIFSRCGVNYLAVEAESGPIGGDASHEFMAPAENGEDSILHCKDCGYAANQEKSEIGARDCTVEPVEQKPLTKLDTPNVTTIEQVCKFLKCKPQKMIKTLIYMADDKPIAVLVRGDHDANEGKIRRACKISKLELAPPEVIQKVTGAPVGFAGPVGMKEKIPVYADRDVKNIANGITGANAGDAHIVNVNLTRDYTPDLFADLRNAIDGDPCPRCCGKLAMRHAIEIGHVFKLGTKYTDSLNAKFTDAAEQLKPIIMGCYGIGVNRILASLIETSHDENGIIWPMTLAPYEVVLTLVKVPDEPSMAAAKKLYDELTAAGIDVLLDDRDCRAGVKFKDADLVGIPLRIVVGERGLKEGKFEVKWRWESGSDMLPIEGAAETISHWIKEERKENARFKKAAAKE